MNVLEEGISEETPWSRSLDNVQAHYSSIMLHRKCPQAWYYRYGKGLSKPVTDPAPYMHYGSWFGAIRTAEALVRGRRMGSLIQTPRTLRLVDGGPEFDMRTMTPKMVLESAVVWYHKNVAGDPLAVEDWHSKLGDGLPQRLLAGYQRWRDENGVAAAKERPLAVEMFWKRELIRPKADLAWDPAAIDLPELTLIGFIDELYEDIERSIVVVRDNKTTSRMPTMSSLDDMLDSQLMLYAWGVTPALQKMGHAIPRAISYDRAMSVKCADPSLNLNGTISAKSKNWDLRTYREWALKDTRPDSLDELRQVAVTNGKRDTYDDFSPEQKEIIENLPAGRVFGRIGEFKAVDVPKFGIYELDDEIIRKLSSPDWRAMFHQRTLKPINQQVVKAHLRAAIDTTTDIWKTQTRSEVTGEATRNLIKDSCKWCEYVGICRAQIFGGPDGLYDIREYGLRHKSGNHILENGVIKEQADA